ncbi:hypothetical protein BDF19DRAFT_430597 [Syncephalis fuscata]|nr:hypothetical protein BDF19DRAFT_430597 [Syncephalis fuscata]
MKRASATMLACRMLTEHRVQSAAAVTLTTTSNNNNSNLNEPVINNTLCGFMQKLGRLLDHSPDILEIILMTLSIGESDLALKNCASVHCLEPSTETITDSTPKDLNDDNRQNSSLNTKAVTALEDKSTKKEKRCHVDWQSCRQQLLYWLLARSDSCSRRVYQLHPVLLAEVAESQQPFANVYADHLLKLTNAQLEAVPSSLNVTDANAASIPSRTHMVYLLPGMIPTTGSAALIYVPLRDYWCCLLTKGARMCQLICHRFTQLCSLSLESANETNTNTTNTTTDSNNNNNSSSSSHNNGSSMNDQPTTKMAASLKQYLINLGLDL